MAPSISVNIACQDEEELLPYTLYCIEQVLSPYLAEVVLIDGGSQDNTLSIIEWWRSRLPIVLIEHPFDAVGWQRNRGLGKCTGDWILRVDADMTFTKNLGPLLSDGFFDKQPADIWVFGLYYIIIDEFHRTDDASGGFEAMWRNHKGYEFIQGPHPKLNRGPRRSTDKVFMLEHSLLSSGPALLRRGQRWQPHRGAEKEVGPGHGPPDRYVKAAKRCLAGATRLPSGILRNVIPRPPLHIIAPRPLESPYGHHHFKDHRKAHQGERSRNFARQIISVWEEPASVIDLGCSSAAHLEPFYERGIAVWGVDSDPWVLAEGTCCIPRDRIEIHDLRVPYTPHRKYSLCICTEVLEHIEPEYANIAIDSICRCSDRLFLTIAVPGQGGIHHVNLKPIEEWQKDFEKRGFERMDPPEEIAGWPGLLIMERG